jgi:FkbM family methyltransferase
VNIKQLVQTAFGVFGFRIVRNKTNGGYFQRTEPFFAALKARGFCPKHIIDVGANHGWWTRSALNYFPDAHYTLIEPQLSLKQSVQDLLTREDNKIRWIEAGGGDKSGTMFFSIAADRDDTATFAVTADYAADRGLRRVEVPVITLNEIVRSSDAPFPDMVKIDAEGFDLRVLAGASDLIGKTDIFLLEALVYPHPLNLENTLEKVLTIMSRAGYHPIDITEITHHSEHGILIVCEVAFLRDQSLLFSGIREDLLHPKASPP